MSGINVGGLELGIPELPGAGHKEDIYNEFVNVFNALRRVESSINNELGLAGIADASISELQVTDGVSARKDRAYVMLSEAASFGQVLSFHPVSGEIRARLAKSTAPEFRCWAICNTAGTHSPGAVVEAALGNCLVESIAGLTPGQEYFLSSVPGILTNVPDPLTDTNIQQSIGVALGGNAFWFCPSAAGKLVSLTITP
jgi:hypothetical protein